jgi:DNA-binding MarR family transcriptional regulator
MKDPVPGCTIFTLAAGLKFVFNPQGLRGRKCFGEAVGVPARRTAAEQTTSAQLADQVEAVMLASRVLVGISAQSIAAVEDRVSLGQFRALVVIASLQPVNLVRLAQALGVHGSNATRACDRLVALGLVDRRDNPSDRRHLNLALTAQGQRIVSRVMNHRRRAIDRALRRMPSAERGQLALVLAAFAAAAGEPLASDLWATGWTAELPQRSNNRVGAADG